MAVNIASTFCFLLSFILCKCYELRCEPGDLNFPNCDPNSPYVILPGYPPNYQGPQYAYTYSTNAYQYPLTTMPYNSPYNNYVPYPVQARYQNQGINYWPNQNGAPPQQFPQWSTYSASSNSYSSPNFANIYTANPQPLQKAMTNFTSEPISMVLPYDNTKSTNITFVNGKMLMENQTETSEITSTTELTTTTEENLDVVSWSWFKG